MSDQPDTEYPDPGYLTNKQLKQGVSALKDYIKKSKALKLSCAQRKNLLEAGDKDPTGMAKVVVEVVFKNIPTNSRTYIHNVVLPHHWRLQCEPEDYNIAIFVQHKQAETEAQKIQFNRDRDLDIENTHSFYQDLFNDKLEESIRSRISRIITSKEFATEFNTFQKLDRLSKTYDLFLSEKQLMANKMNPLPRRLGRRFWVREKKVPLMVSLSSKKLNEKFVKCLSSEQFYVLGRSPTEKIQIGLISQPDGDLVENMKTFLDKLYGLYGSDVRYIKLRTNWGIAIPLYADLNSHCPKVVMRKLKNKIEAVVDEFDLLDGDEDDAGNAKISVRADGTVKVIRPKRKRSEVEAPIGEDEDEPRKIVKKIKKKSKLNPSPIVV